MKGPETPYPGAMDADYLRDQGYTKISDRFEPFAKLVLKVTRRKQYADVAAKHPRGVNLGAVLQECGLAEEKEIRAWAACPWQSFPPADLRGKPDFKEQLGWTYRSRKGIELTVRPRSAEEYRVANPLLPVVNAPSVEEELGVFKVPEANRVTVIEGEAGAGKTTALELIACREADRLLNGEDHTARLPVSASSFRAFPVSALAGVGLEPHPL